MNVHGMFRDWVFTGQTAYSHCGDYWLHIGSGFWFFEDDGSAPKPFLHCLPKGLRKMIWRELKNELSMRESRKRNLARVNVMAMIKTVNEREM